MNYEYTDRLPNIFPNDNNCNFIVFEDIVKYFKINKLDLERTELYKNFIICLN